MPGLELVVLGQCPPREPLDLGFPIHFAGYLHDDVSLCLHYSAADAVVVPSRQESFSNVCAEANACGTPAVVFNASALGNIVEHEKTGFLAKPFDTEDLARGIHWVMADAERRAALGFESRQAAVEGSRIRWSLNSIRSFTKRLAVPEDQAGLPATLSSLSVLQAGDLCGRRRRCRASVMRLKLIATID